MNEHDALACSLALRLGACTMDDLRTLDGVMRDLERKRDRQVDQRGDVPPSDEAHEWDRDRHLTRTSLEPARMALDEAEEPYHDLSVDLGFDSSDIGGGCEDG